MQDKRFYPYLFLHAGIVTLWVILDFITLNWVCFNHDFSPPNVLAM